MLECLSIGPNASRAHYVLRYFSRAGNVELLVPEVGEMRVVQISSELSRLNRPKVVDESDGNAV
jgi:hypothetical protein